MTPIDGQKTDACACSRRELVGTVGALTAGLAWPGLRAAPAASLNFSNWDADAHPSCLAPFTAASRIGVKRSSMLGTDRQFATLKAGGGREWDVISPRIEAVSLYIEAGMLRKLDLSKVPNVSAMYSAFRNSPLVRNGEDVYALPYLWGLNPVIYRADEVRGLVDYSTLFDARYKGRIATWDEPLSGIGVAAMHLGIPPTEAFDLGTRELAEVKKLLLFQRRLLRAYWKDLAEINQLFESGEVVVAYSWRNPYDRLKDRLPLRLGTPPQGALGWCSCFALPRHTPPRQVELAYQLVNHLLSESFAQCMGIVGPYAGVNSAARASFNPAQRRAIFIDDPAAIATFLWPKAPANYAEWQKLWEEVKAS